MIPKPHRIVTREEASARRMSWYFTGKPCKRGHVSTRNFNNSSCHACKRREKPSPKDALAAERVRRKAFHDQWLAERRQARAERLEQEYIKRGLALLD